MLERSKGHCDWRLRQAPTSQRSRQISLKFSQSLGCPGRTSETLGCYFHRMRAIKRYFLFISRKSILFFHLFGVIWPLTHPETSYRRQFVLLYRCNSFFCSELTADVLMTDGFNTMQLQCAMHISTMYCSLVVPASFVWSLNVRLKTIFALLHESVAEVTPC